MYELRAKVIIEGEQKWELLRITACEIVRDTESLTDTCKLTIPKNTKWVGATDSEKSAPIKRGDKVKVWLGYDDRLELAFIGYIRDIGFKTPMVLTCEDEMFRLKQQPAKAKAYKSVTIEQLLSDQGIKQEIRVLGEQNLGQYRVKADTVASLLGHLKQQGIRSFFRYEPTSRGGQSTELVPVLYVGVLFDHKELGDDEPPQVFATGINIISDSDLKQVKADTMRIKVKAISIMPNNKRIKVEVGDGDGELKKVFTYNKQESELKKWAEQEVKRLKRDGLTGSFTTFGYKLVDKLEVIAIKIDGKRQGKYQVKKNTIKFDNNGYRQTIVLGFRTK